MDIFVNAREVVRICDRFAEGGMQKLYDEFFKQHMEDGYILRPDHIDLEINLSYIVEGIRRNVSLI